MSKPLEAIRGFYARYRKRGAIVLAIIVAVELLAAVAVVFAGREWLDSRSAAERSDSRSAPALGLQGSRFGPSVGF